MKPAIRHLAHIWMMFNVRGADSRAIYSPLNCMITSESDANEAVPFSEWMRRALFDPQRGYYARQIRTVGRRGDFTTSAGIGDALGEAVAGWLVQEFKNTPDVRTVIEVGGGDGSLMRSLRHALGFFTRWRLRFFMVESSPVLQTQQKATLGGKAVTWFDDLPAALEACGGRAFIYHNELLDAFPVTLAEWDGSAWREVWLSWKGGLWIEELRALSIGAEERPEFSALSQQPSVFPQRVELGSAAQSWFRGWAPKWNQGAMLTLDYGDEFPQLYHRQPRGTLRAYLLHERLTGASVYENMGRQDITADVNFTDLLRWGESCGWEASNIETQREFLARYLRRFEQRIGQDQALRFLADEHGAGTAFRALVQRAQR
ncbi:MAG: SAM-dependent methyltransferase [Verrucomicrobia bacterium]|nr:SAM-dependent methyltransferase [Verrucomicrobiota bacterium]